MEKIEWSDFERVDLRVGTIIKVEDFPEARRPAYKVWVDFGSDLGIKKSSAQVTEHYKINDLQGKQIVAVVNFPSKQIGPFMSEILITGFADSHGGVILATPDKDVPNGARLF